MLMALLSVPNASQTPHMGVARKQGWIKDITSRYSWVKTSLGKMELQPFADGL